VAELDQRPATRRRHARLLLALSTTQWKLKKLPEARKNAEEVRDLLTGAKLKQAAELAECLDLLGRISFEEGKMAEAQGLFKQALAADEVCGHRDPKVLTERYRRLAGACWGAGCVDEARTALEQALASASAAYGETHQLTLDCQTDLGQCELERGEYASAMKLFEKGLRVHQHICGPFSDEVARDYELLATGAHRSGNLEVAVHCYEKALRLREQQLGGSGSDFATLLMNLADIHSTEGRSAQAVELLQQAVGKLEGARDERLPAALNSLGEVYFQCGRFEDANVSLNRARGYWQKAPEKYTQALIVNGEMLEELKRFLVNKQEKVPSGLRAPAPSVGPTPILQPARMSTPEPAAVIPISPTPVAAAAQQGDSGVQLNFVRPDGSQIERGSNTLHLTVLVPEGEIPKKAVATLPSVPPPRLEKPGLSGWEDLAFEFLQTI
jgi:tetratricopeptide (TPR) repeat protein